MCCSRNSREFEKGGKEMRNDLISRSALIAELEGFKLSLGDVFFGMVVDRVIERVKAQPTIKQEVTNETV